MRQVRRTAAGEAGELRLGYIGPPTRPFLGPLLEACRRSHPGGHVVLEERTPERVWDRHGDDPAVAAFRILALRWLAEGRLGGGCGAATHEPLPGPP